MPNELQHQSNIIKAVIASGGWGFKLSNAFLSGIPDLLLLHKGRVAFVEVKLVTTCAQVVKTSPVQVLVLNKVKAVGCMAALLVVVAGERGKPKYFAAFESFKPRRIDDGGFVTMNVGHDLDLEKLFSGV
jgi:hypothetical protein